jgi:putative ubiquitin-RnfH superfamily antitoxin RatB of RatAB toxin-antitoxin module
MATRQRKKVTKADFIPKGTTPYDNGKIKMGIYYQKPKYVEMDGDMLEIQKWLIGDPDKLRFEYWLGVTYKLLIAFVITIIVLMNIKG